MAFMKTRSKVTRIKKRAEFTVQKLVATCGLLLAIFLAAIMIVQADQYYRLKQEILASQARLDQYEARRQCIQEEIERLNDNEYIELLARKYLGLVKPGEIVFQLND